MTARQNNPRRFYLNGIDWIVQGMQYNCQAAPGGNYQFLIISHLAGTPGPGRLRGCLHKLQEMFPLLSGKLRRNWFNLAPYWQAPFKAVPEDILTVVQLNEPDPEQACHQHLTGFLNTPFKDDMPKLAAMLLILPDGSSRLALNFDHCLFDAAGGEQLITVLNDLWNGAEPDASGFMAAEGPWLNEWRHQFVCGRTVNRALLAVRRQGPPSVLSSKPGGSNRYVLIQLDEAGFAALMKRADSEAGPMMLTPYLVTTIQEALHRIFSRRGDPNSICVCPMTVSLRQGRRDELFFNRWSLMPMYSSSVSSHEERLKQQVGLFYAYMKTKLPYSLTKACLLCRPLPLPLIAGFSQKPVTSGTAAIALLSQMEFDSVSMFGEEIKALYHVPRIPPSPGLGIFMNRRGSKLNITLSWTDGIIDDDELEILTAAIS
ncbi:MAG: hypothetical protein WCV67_19875 [Victivallaceae bacterium]|jgi:hypothetical protein